MTHPHDGGAERHKFAPDRGTGDRRAVRRLRRPDFRSELQGHLPPMWIHTRLQRSVSRALLRRFRRLPGTSSF